MPEIEAGLRDLLSTTTGAPGGPTSSQVPGMGADGTPQIASMIAVWLLSQVGKALGVARVVNLRKVDRAELRSISGVARLLHRTMHSQTVTS